MTTFDADRYVLGFEEVDRTQIAAVGGKGANLGELSRIAGVRVPAGFCVTTDAFRRIMADADQHPRSDHHPDCPGRHTAPLSR